MKKAAIEFSANTIVIIIIAVIMLATGLILFNTLIGGGKSYTESVKEETQLQLRNIILSNTDHIAMYKNSLNLEGGKSELVTLGVKNILQTAYFSFEVKSVKYSNDTNNEVDLWGSTWKFGEDEAIFFTNDYNTVGRLGQIGQNLYIYKNIRVFMPKTMAPGTYVVTFQVKSCSDSSYVTCTDYGITKLYLYNS